MQFLSTLHPGYSPSPHSSGSAFQTTLGIAEITCFDYDIFYLFFFSVTLQRNCWSTMNIVLVCDYFRPFIIQFKHS